MTKLIKTVGLLGILASSVIASDSNPADLSEKQHLTNASEGSSYQSLSEVFDFEPLEDTSKPSEPENNKEDLIENPEKEDFEFSPKKNRCMAIGLRVATNIIIPAALITGGYYLTNYVYNSNVAYYTYPNFQPNNQECYRLTACPCYSYSISLSPNDPLPNINLSTIQNNCNLSDSSTEIIADFIVDQLQIIGKVWNYPQKSFYADSTCIQDVYVKGQIYAEHIRNSLSFRTSVSHYYPECLASNSPYNYWIPAGTTILGIAAMVGINILIPGCLY